MKENKITIIEGDEWTGVYVNGKLKYQNDHVELKHVLKSIGIKSEVKYADLEWLGQEGVFPHNLKDCKFSE